MLHNGFSAGNLYLRPALLCGHLLSLGLMISYKIVAYLSVVILASCSYLPEPPAGTVGIRMEENRDYLLVEPLDTIGMSETGLGSTPVDWWTRMLIWWPRLLYNRAWDTG